MAYLKTCDVCGKAKSALRDFYAGRAQCIDCYNTIRAVKRARKLVRRVTVDSVPAARINRKWSKK